MRTRQVSTYKHHISFDEQTGLILVRIEGFQHNTDVTAYMTDLTRMVGQVRARGRRVRVLADVSLAVVRSPLTATQQKTFNDVLYRVSDRVALVVTSPLLHLQIKRTSACSIQRSFADYQEAESWLLEADMTSAFDALATGKPLTVAAQAHG